LGCFTLRKYESKHMKLLHINSKLTTNKCNERLTLALPQQTSADTRISHLHSV
jgi:hypothetical protein